MDTHTDTHTGFKTQYGYPDNNKKIYIYYIIISGMSISLILIPILILGIKLSMGIKNKRK